MTENTKTPEAHGTKQQREPKLIRFLLVRTEDETGVSGEGIVAEGVQFTNGQCVMSWLTEFTSVAVYPNAEEIVKIHGHDGRTTISWCTDDDAIESAVSLHT